MRTPTLRALALAAALPSMATAQMAAPLIELTPTDGGMTVTGIVTGLASGTVLAEVTIAKNDTSGSVATRQSREIAVSENSRDVVATTSLSAGPEARITIEMTLTADGSVIGRARTVLGPQD